jgi:hypothetical protein
MAKLTGTLAKLALWRNCSLLAARNFVQRTPIFPLQIFGWGLLSRLAKLALWQNLRSGKTCALAKLALWQNWRSGKLALWQNCPRSGKLALWQMDKKPKT